MYNINTKKYNFEIVNNRTLVMPVFHQEKDQDPDRTIFHRTIIIANALDQCYLTGGEFPTSGEWRIIRWGMALLRKYSVKVINW